MAGQRRAIIWTDAGMLLIGHCGTNFSEILSKIDTFSFKKMHLKMSSVKRWPFCLGLNVLKLKLAVGMDVIRLDTDIDHNPVNPMASKPDLNVW